MAAPAEGPADEFEGALAVSTLPAEDDRTELRLERIRAARIKGYEGNSCAECGNFTLIRNGTASNATPAALPAVVHSLFSKERTTNTDAT